jgi:hypothetical protein
VKWIFNNRYICEPKHTFYNLHSFSLQLLDSEDIRSLLPHQASSRWFTCSAGPSGVVPGVGAAAESGAPSGSLWRMLKGLIAFQSSSCRVLVAKFPGLVCNFFFLLDLLVILHRRNLMAVSWSGAFGLCSKKCNCFFSFRKGGIKIMHKSFFIYYLTNPYNENM